MYPAAAMTVLCGEKKKKVGGRFRVFLLKGKSMFFDPTLTLKGDEKSPKELIKDNTKGWTKKREQTKRENATLLLCV